VIAIARLHIGAILPEWLTAWEQLQKPTTPDGQPDWVTFQAVRQVVHSARNDIIRAVLREVPHATHVFFLDDDVLVPPDGLLRLLADSVAHDIPIVSGLYIMRGEPHLPVVYRAHPGGHHVQVTAFCPGLQEIDAAGAGALLIRMDVLRALEAEGQRTGEWWFDYLPPFSEDLSFCVRARRLGFRLALDWDVQCGHLTTIEVTYETFQQRSDRGEVGYGSEELRALSQQVRPWQADAVQAEGAQAEAVGVPAVAGTLIAGPRAGGQP
jgi:hypothetical protein